MVPDLEVTQDNAGPAAEYAGPSTETKWENHNHDGPAKNTEFQWDKRVQNVGDLTDKPGGGKFIHDVTKGEGTRVAVIDDGVFDQHPDLTSVVNEDLSENFTSDEYDFRPNGAGSHGTHVAGTIAATNSNTGPTGGVLGTAPNTEIVALRVFSNAWGTTGDTLAAIMAAADKGCDVANISLGFSPFNPGYYASFIRESYRRVADYAKQNGMLIVTSAGNSAVDIGKEDIVSLPSEVDGIFSVASTGPIGFGWGDKHDNNEQKWLKGDRLEKPSTYPSEFTNYGDGIDLSASGGNYVPGSRDTNPKAHLDYVYSTIYKRTQSDEIVPAYGWKAGTSMAAPQVAGAIALIRSLRPRSTPDEVTEYLKETAVSGPGGSKYHGAGHLNLKRLLKRIH